MALKRRPWPIPFLDLSNVLFFFFAALFAVALLVIAEDQPKAKADTTSKLLIHLTWRDGSPNDVDLSLKTPAGNVVWFRDRQADFASLDHDNLGSGSSSVVDAEGNTYSIAGRDEVIFVRGTVPGTYIVNVHLYAQYGGQAEPVDITLTSVDPNYRVVTERKLVLTERHEEHTAFRFTVDQSGAVTSTDLVEELFINELLARPS